MIIWSWTGYLDWLGSVQFVLIWRRAWKSWTSIWYFPTKHCFPSGSASWIHSLVLSCETANWWSKDTVIEVTLAGVCLGHRETPLQRRNDSRRSQHQKKQSHFLWLCCYSPYWIRGSARHSQVPPWLCCYSPYWIRRSACHSRRLAAWWGWVVFTLGFIWSWNWFSKYCIIPM